MIRTLAHKFSMVITTVEKFYGTVLWHFDAENIKRKLLKLLFEPSWQWQHFVGWWKNLDWKRQQVGSSTVAKHLTHNPNIKGQNPAAGTVR